MAVAYKEQRRLWLRDALAQMNVADPDALATQVAILVEGAIVAALVRGDPGMAGAAKAAARVLLTAAGVRDPDAAPEPVPRTGQARSRKSPKRPAARKARLRVS
jgi:hypothetical protein